MDEQLALLKKNELVDLEGLLGAVRYMKEYPDYVHHPQEDVIFNYYLSKHDTKKSTIHSLLNEHQTMPPLTDKLSIMLQNAIFSVPQKREELCAYLEEYIDTQKKHMDFEEATIYPILRESLTDNDWNQVEDKLKQVDDPLFGNQVETSFKELLQQIVS